MTGYSPRTFAQSLPSLITGAIRAYGYASSHPEDTDGIAIAHAYLGIGLSSLWRRAKTDPSFPKPRKLSPRTTIWMREELDAFLARCATKKGGLNHGMASSPCWISLASPGFAMATA